MQIIYLTTSQYADTVTRILCILCDRCQILKVFHLITFIRLLNNCSNMNYDMTYDLSYIQTILIRRILVTLPYIRPQSTPNSEK